MTRIDFAGPGMKKIVTKYRERCSAKREEARTESELSQSARAGHLRIFLVHLPFLRCHLPHNTTAGDVRAYSKIDNTPVKFTYGIQHFYQTKVAGEKSGQLCNPLYGDLSICPCVCDCNIQGPAHLWLHAIIHSPKQTARNDRRQPAQNWIFKIVIAGGFFSTVMFGGFISPNQL